MPLPEHAWSEFPPDQLLKVDVSSKFPLGWGPYIIDKWEPGKSLHFIKILIISAPIADCQSLMN